MKDKAYVFSVAPYIATKKQFGHGPTVHIAAKPEGARYSVTDVPKATCYKDFGSGQKEVFDVDPMAMIDDLVKECTTSFGKMGVWGSEDPVPSEAEIAQAEADQMAFYKEAVKEGDKQWARFRDVSRIPYHAMVGASELNMVRDWAKDTASLIPCVGCRELIAQDAVKCGKCGSILDWERAADLGLVTAEQMDFATRRNLPGTKNAVPKASAK